jgi:hypothetical protein
MSGCDWCSRGDVPYVLLDRRLGHRGPLGVLHHCTAMTLEHPCGHTWRAPELEGECEVCRVLEDDEEAEEEARRAAQAERDARAELLGWPFRVDRRV